MPQGKSTMSIKTPDQVKGLGGAYTVVLSCAMSLLKILFFMTKPPYSNKDIAQLKTTVYAPPKPLTWSGVFILIVLFPCGIYSLFSRYTTSFILSQCKSEEEREKYFSYLQTAP